MLSLLENRHHDLIKVNKGPNPGRDFLVNKTQNMSGMCVGYVDTAVPPVLLNNSMKYHANLTMDRIFNISCCTSFVAFIESEGYPSSPLYLYLYPFRVLNSNWTMDTDLLSKAQNISTKKEGSIPEQFITQSSPNYRFWDLSVFQKGKKLIQVRGVTSNPFARV
jgi:hypothetical protein